MALLFSAFLVLGTTVACGGGGDDHAEYAEEAEPVADAPAPAAAPANDGPRVFFANLKEGEEVTSPVNLEFGIENFEIVPASDPPDIQEGKGHHHLGIGVHCVEAGTVIVKGTPSWQHFGDGSSSVSVQLPPGPAHLSLQVGDDEHRTLHDEGLCAMISFTVIEEGV